MYNLQSSYKQADVWRSEDGSKWEAMEKLTGDYFAQNIDVVQPGSIAPWYHRFGHSLNAVDIDGNGVEDIMVLAGGYSSSPSNDVWVTEDGINWLYTGLAPWSPRAWHGAVVFNSSLYIMGGSPLNNEVWVLRSAVKYKRRQPLTRAMYSDYTYKLEWEFLGNADWSPRVGMGVVSQHYFNYTQLETIADSKERMLLVGGYGGWVEGEHKDYDGYFCRNDVWESFDGIYWKLLGFPDRVNGRAWFGMVTQRGEDPRMDPLVPELPPKIYLVGGGYVGFQTANKKRVISMQGKADAYWSRDGLNWTRINYQEGGGTTGFTFYSSQEWARTVVDTKIKYLGLWGLTLNQYNTTSHKQFPGNLLLIGGLYTDGGEYSKTVYTSLGGVICDTEGAICSNRGNCTINGCTCEEGFAGLSCENDIGGGVVSAAYSSTAYNYVVFSLSLLATIHHYYRTNY